MADNNYPNRPSGQDSMGSVGVTHDESIIPEFTGGGMLDTGGDIFMKQPIKFNEQIPDTPAHARWNKLVRLMGGSPNMTGKELESNLAGLAQRNYKDYITVQKLAHSFQTMGEEEYARTPMVRGIIGYENKNGGGFGNAGGPFEKKNSMYVNQYMDRGARTGAKDRRAVPDDGGKRSSYNNTVAPVLMKGGPSGEELHAAMKTLNDLYDNWEGALQAAPRTTGNAEYVKYLQDVLNQYASAWERLWDKVAEYENSDDVRCMKAELEFKRKYVEDPVGAATPDEINRYRQDVAYLEQVFPPQSDMMRRSVQQGEELEKKAAKEGDGYYSLPNLLGTLWQMNPLSKIKLFQ